MDNNITTKYNLGDKVYVKNELLNNLESSVSMREILEISFKMEFPCYGSDYLTKPANPYYQVKISGHKKILPQSELFTKEEQAKLLMDLAVKRISFNILKFKYTDKYDREIYIRPLWYNYTKSHIKKDKEYNIVVSDNNQDDIGILENFENNSNITQVVEIFSPQDISESEYFLSWLIEQTEDCDFNDFKQFYEENK